MLVKVTRTATYREAACQPPGGRIGHDLENIGSTNGHPSAVGGCRLLNSHRHTGYYYYRMPFATESPLGYEFIEYSMIILLAQLCRILKIFYRIFIDYSVGLKKKFYRIFANIAIECVASVVFYTIFCNAL